MSTVRKKRRREKMAYEGLDTLPRTIHDGHEFNVTLSVKVSFVHLCPMVLSADLSFYIKRVEVIACDAKTRNYRNQSL